MVKHFAINQDSMTILEMLNKADEEINKYARENHLRVISVDNKGRTTERGFNGYIFVAVFGF